MSGGPPPVRVLLPTAAGGKCISAVPDAFREDVGDAQRKIHHAGPEGPEARDSSAELIG